MYYLLFLASAHWLLAATPACKKDAAATGDVGLIVNGDVAAKETAADAGGGNGGDAAVADGAASDTAPADASPADSAQTDAAAADAAVADVPVADALSPDDVGDDISMQAFELVSSAPADGAEGLAQPLTLRLNSMTSSRANRLRRTQPLSKPVPATTCPATG